MACSKELNLVGKKGVALIISNDYAGTGFELKGTHKDSKKMEEVFNHIQYHVIKVLNVDKKDLEGHFTTLSEYQYPLTCRRIVVTFSGHGGDGVLICQDLQKIEVKDMVNQFKPNDKNPTLGNTVRLFFIDACRGNLQDEGCIAKGNDGMKEDNMENDDTEEDVVKVLNRVPIEGNTYVGYSSTRLYVSYDTASGGLFTSILADELLNDAPLDTNFIAANAKMSERKVKGQYFQTAHCAHSLKEDVNFIKEFQGQEGKGDSTSSSCRENSDAKRRKVEGETDENDNGKTGSTKENDVVDTGLPESNNWRGEICKKNFIPKDAQVEWRALGYELKFTSAQLDNIEKLENKPVQKCCEEMLVKWKRKATEDTEAKRQLVAAVQAVEHVVYADELEGIPAKELLNDDYLQNTFAEKIASDWKGIGTELGLKMEALNNIEGNKNPIEAKYMKMFTKWLNNTPGPLKAVLSKFYTALINCELIRAADWFKREVYKKFSCELTEL